MKLKLYLAYIVGAVLLVGAGCVPSQKGMLTRVGSEIPPEAGVSSKPDYIVKDWRIIKTPDSSISFPSEFSYIPPMAEAPNIYTFWADKVINFEVAGITSSVWCSKKTCSSPQDLTRIGARELFNFWKIDPNAKSVATNIDGYEALVLTKSFKGTDRTIVAFVYNDILYAISQSDTGEYVSNGQPLLLKIVKSIKFNK